MNFKRFHESKNLLNPSDILPDTMFNVNAVSPAFVYSDTFNCSNYIPVTSGTYLRMLNNVAVGNYFFEFDANKKYLRQKAPGKGKPMTISNDASYITFNIYKTYDINKYMFARTSTPLPYEPYSSEVWHDTPHYIHNTSTDTITTLPAVVYANDTTATVGLKGQMEQNGTPPPDNPIQPQECGERTGNLFDYTKTDGIITNKYINQSGTIVNNNEYYMSCPIKVNVGETYTWRFNSDRIDANHTAPTVGFYDDSDNLLSTAQHDKTVKYFSFEVPANCAYIRASVFTRNNAQQEAMLNTGSTPLPYEPYGQYKIPILSGGVTTPVYLGEVESTRRIKKVVLDGTETFTYDPEWGSRFVFTFPDMKVFGLRLTPFVSTHYQSIDDGRSWQDIPDKSIYSGSDDSTYKFFIKDTTFSSVSDFANYLASQYAAGTPVTVWYVLAEPTTGIVNEPIRKIGDYADEVSGITIPVTAGANTLSIDTTLQPSEVSVNYKGWHPVQNVHEAENGQWD